MGAHCSVMKKIRLHRIIRFLAISAIYDMSSKIDFNTQYKIIELNATPLCLDFWWVFLIGVVNPSSIIHKTLLLTDNNFSRKFTGWNITGAGYLLYSNKLLSSINSLLSYAGYLSCCPYSRIGIGQFGSCALDISEDLDISMWKYGFDINHHIGFLRVLRGQLLKL